MAVSHEKAIETRDKTGLFYEICSSFTKATVTKLEKSLDEMESALRQLASHVIVSTEVVDIFAVTGLAKPAVSLLSDDFFDEAKQLPDRNLALELLKKFISNETKVRTRKNVAQIRFFQKCLEKLFVNIRIELLQ